MAAVDDEVDDRFKDIDIESILSRVQRRPLTFSRRKTVLKAPEFVKRLSGEEAVDEGADLTLQFKVVGIPPPTLRWFKDDEEVSDHPRLSVDKKEDGSHLLTLHAVNKGDEAAYRCRAENSEGSSSCCFFLSVKAKPKSPKRDGKLSPNKRTVSYPTMFSTIVEKVEEEEKAGRETAQAPESPLSHFYDSLSIKSRSTWPSFLGDWAFVSGTHKARGGSTGSYCSSGSEADFGECENAESWQSDDVFADSPEKAGQDLEPSTPRAVFCLEARRIEPQRLGTVPQNVDSAPQEAATRGFQVLTSVATNQKPVSISSTQKTLSSTRSDAQTKPDSTPPSISHKPEQKLLQERKAGSTPTVTKGTTQSKTTFAGSSTGEHSRLKGLASTLAPLYVAKTSNDSATRMELVKAADPSKKTDRCDVLGVNSLPTAPHELGENKMERSKGGNGGLAPPLPEREEREPTPIPPEMLVIPQKTSSSHVTPSCQWTEDAFLCGSALQAPSEAKDRKTSKVDLDVAASVVVPDVAADMASEDSISDNSSEDHVTGEGHEESVTASQAGNFMNVMEGPRRRAPPTTLPLASILPRPYSPPHHAPHIVVTTTAITATIATATDDAATATAATTTTATDDAATAAATTVGPTEHGSSAADFQGGADVKTTFAQQPLLAGVRVKAAHRNARRPVQEQRSSWRLGEMVLGLSALTFLSLYLDIPPHVFMLLVFGVFSVILYTQRHQLS